jgi:hypothetical protein
VDEERQRQDEDALLREGPEPGAAAETTRAAYIDWMRPRFAAMYAEWHDAKRRKRDAEEERKRNEARWQWWLRVFNMASIFAGLVASAYAVNRWWASGGGP